MGRKTASNHFYCLIAYYFRYKIFLWSSSFFCSYIAVFFICVYIIGNNDWKNIFNFLFCYRTIATFFMCELSKDVVIIAKTKYLWKWWPLPDNFIKAIIIMITEQYIAQTTFSLATLMTLVRTLLLFWMVHVKKLKAKHNFVWCLSNDTFYAMMMMSIELRTMSIITVMMTKQPARQEAGFMGLSMFISDSYLLFLSLCSCYILHTNGVNHIQYKIGFDRFPLN